MMDAQNARAWLDALAVAWRSRDAQKMADLFTPDATDQADPFKPPTQGREYLRAGFAAWMQDQTAIQIRYGEIDVIGQRFYAYVDSEWIVASSGEKVQERGLLVCDMDGKQVRRMREFWKTRKGRGEIPK